MNLVHRIMALCSFTAAIGFAGGVMYGRLYEPLGVEMDDLDGDGRDNDLVVESYNGNYYIFVNDGVNLMPLDWLPDRYDKPQIRENARRVMETEKILEDRANGR
ncbi:MAG TPA: hypothetical protein VJH20_04670 [Candidatus Nanoarchaeia archaeon]|nr:hypothetical protein [Candidatus Nanoarchaeia archaeon]